MSTGETPRDARAEAQAHLGPDQTARVLEPSPPADTDQWFADDPTARGDVRAGLAVVSPISDGDLAWSEITEGFDELEAWARRRWLGPWPRLGPLPAGFADARVDMNRLAFYVLSTAREDATGKIALRWTLDGWGTPFFGNDVQLRVEGAELVRQDRDGVAREPITTLAAAADLAGVALDPKKHGEFDVPEMGDPERALAADPASLSALGAWFGFAWSVLEELRRDAREDEDPGRVQLWAEHFDPATEIGDADAGRRASFGASPGDANHPEPYLYVAPWGEVDRAEPFWSDPHFNGGALSYAGLLAADDQRAAALTFYREGLALLRGG